MNTSAFRQPKNVGIMGRFYCAFDPLTSQIKLTIEASSVNEAQQRLAKAACLCGFTKSEALLFVVLEDAPRGVPTFSADFSAVPGVGRRQTEPAIEF